MTAVSLAGGRLRDDVRTEWDQVEGWLSLGATPRQAVVWHALVSHPELAARQGHWETLAAGAAT